MKSVALYARVSSEQQEKQATVESQVAALTERAKADGHAVVASDVYVDQGYSGATLLKVFMPYLVWNTVFDNTRVTSELGRRPVPFSGYSFPLLKFSRENNFEYQYQPWPAARGGSGA